MRFLSREEERKERRNARKRQLDEEREEKEKENEEETRSERFKPLRKKGKREETIGTVEKKRRDICDLNATQSHSGRRKGRKKKREEGTII